DFSTSSTLQRMWEDANLGKFQSFRPGRDCTNQTRLPSSLQIQISSRLPASPFTSPLTPPVCSAHHQDHLHIYPRVVRPRLPPHHCCCLRVKTPQSERAIGRGFMACDGSYLDALSKLAAVHIVWSVIAVRSFDNWRHKTNEEIHICAPEACVLKLSTRICGIEEKLEWLYPPGSSSQIRASSSCEIKYKVGEVLLHMSSRFKDQEVVDSCIPALVAPRNARSR
ncbi:hypothetical protein BD779DRAFT_1551513, partial [Infundibulicybe gibba]